MTYLSLAELRLRDEERLPLNADGTLNEDRCQAALEDAAEIVRTILPSLINPDGTPAEPPARLAGSLKPIVRDITLYLLNDRPGEDAAKDRYDRAISLLKALAGGGGGSGDAGPEALSDDSATIVDGYSEFLPPLGGGI